MRWCWFLIWKQLLSSLSANGGQPGTGCWCFWLCSRPRGENKCKTCDQPVQGFPSLGTLWTQGGGGVKQLHSFQPGGFSSLLRSLFLTHSQVDAEIEVAGENEKERDSKEAETEVPKIQMSNTPFWYPTNNCVFQVWCFQWKHLSEQNAVETVKKV